MKLIALLELGDGLAAGIGRAADTFDRIVTVGMIIVIFIVLLLLRLGYKTQDRKSRIIVAVFCALFSLICIFCFQHEVQAYVSGFLLLIACIAGMLLPFM